MPRKVKQDLPAFEAAEQEIAGSADLEVTVKDAPDLEEEVAIPQAAGVLRPAQVLEAGIGRSPVRGDAARGNG